MGVLSGLGVLDLSCGIPGPAAAMLLADNGAEVTRISRPGADPFDGYLDYKTYDRGKRSAVLDLKDPVERDRLLALVKTADVLIESFRPGTAESLGIGYDTLSQVNPRLIYCAVTGYGQGAADAGRPGYDQLVAARTGYQWEVRSWPGSPKEHERGEERLDPSLAPDEERWYLNRKGPAFIGTPAPSVNAGYLAALGISAALKARNTTGRGQRVETSLLQGILGYQCSGWQRLENAPASTGMEMTSAITLFCNWDIFRCADGWVNMWTGNKEWAKEAAAGDTLVQPDAEKLQARMRELMATGRNPMMGGFDARLEARLETAPYFLKFPTADWQEAASEVMQSMQTIRAPEVALNDPALLEEGCVTEVEDPELGRLRQVGLVYRLMGELGRPGERVPRRGEHTEQVQAEADAAKDASAAVDASVVVEAGSPLSAPLAGIRALDFGLAVAGPWGGELLSQLGAEVIKIDPERQRFWLANSMGLGVNRSKRHLMIDAKHPEGVKVIHELVKTADLVMMNLRPAAAKRLGIDYDSLRKINPQIIVCLQRGNDLSRADLPSNDQQGNAIAGTEYEEGGVANGGKPHFSGGTGGDLGNGALSAIAMVQALYHRDRTGEGMEVDSSICNAGLFATSRIYTDAEGTRYDRPTVDADLFGMTALYRLYETRDGWICLAALGDAAWQGLTAAVPGIAGDSRFASAAERKANDKDLVATLAQAFLTDTANGWFTRLDAAGVPVEVSSPSSPDQVFDNPDYVQRQLVVKVPGHAQYGTVEMFGKLIDFSDTPVQLPTASPPVAGQHSREILKSTIGYSDDQVDALVEAGAVWEK